MVSFAIIVFLLSFKLFMVTRGFLINHKQSSTKENSGGGEGFKKSINFHELSEELGLSYGNIYGTFRIATIHLRPPHSWRIPTSDVRSLKIGWQTDAFFSNSRSRRTDDAFQTGD